jgi:ribosomal protein S18 acetylase RimI-like enzyme
MLIRRATLADVDLVAPQFDLYRQFYQQPPNPEVARQFITERLQRNESVIFVAVDDTSNPPRAAGFVQLFPLFSSTQARPMWLLNDLYVSALYRRNGIGRQLMEKAREHAVENGACVIELVTAAKNRTAQALYEKVGYKRDEEFVRYELWL